MEIVEVRQKWPKDYLRIEYALGDICNFQCWYCWPDATAAVYKWPDLDKIKRNLSHLLDYYMKNTEKRRFEIAVLGGEVTHWKNFIEFIQYFKERYDIKFTITTNASKKIDWWKEGAKYLDYVYISHHQRFSDMSHNREVMDYLYEQNVTAAIGVLMDPTCWDSCVETVEYFKKSRHKWSIRYTELVHETINYTDEQKAVISKLRARRSNLLYFLRSNVVPKVDPKVVYENNKVARVKDNQIILDRLNNFKNWECSLGIDFFSIRIDGSIRGTCGNLLYTDKQQYNLYDDDFIETFSPTITSTICDMSGCWCGFDANMPKKRLTTTNKMIPIYAN